MPTNAASTTMPAFAIAGICSPIPRAATACAPSCRRSTPAAGRPPPAPRSPRHYHIKVQAPQQRVPTPQLYFPDEPMNRRDGLFRRELEMRMAEAEGALAARFDFVLDMR